MTDVDARPQQASSQDTGEYAYQRVRERVRHEAVAGALPPAATRRSRRRSACTPSSSAGPRSPSRRGANRRTWAYRILPSAKHPPFRRIDNGNLRGTPFDELDPDPNRLRWDPLPLPVQDDTDFIDGLFTVAGNGDSKTRCGLAVHLYAANRSMIDRYFVDSDGELLFVPRARRGRPHTELGPLRVSPGEVAVVPRGIRFRVELPDRAVAAATCARTSEPRSPCPSAAQSAANGLANERDFLSPHAAFEERAHTVQVVNKFGGNLWAARLRPLAARTWSPGTAATCRTSTTRRTSWPSARSASTTRTRRSSPCSPRRATRPARPTATS